MNFEGGILPETPVAILFLTRSQYLELTPILSEDGRNQPINDERKITTLPTNVSHYLAAWNI